MQLPWPFTNNKSAKASTAENETASAISKPAISREQQVDVEFAEWMKELGGPEYASKTVTAPTPAVGGVAPPVSNATRPIHDLTPRVYDDGTIDIRPEIMHPQTMACRQAFDQAFYCQSLGGKFNDIYRFGHFQSCSEQWSAFWRCMAMRTLSEDEKARQTIEYYSKRDEKRKQEKGSSEDVWDIRERSVKRAFWRDPDEARKEET